jgi:hypothetical protein
MFYLTIYDYLIYIRHNMTSWSQSPTWDLLQIEDIELEGAHFCVGDTPQTQFTVNRARYDPGLHCGPRLLLM